jgi:hypothetical protein
VEDALVVEDSLLKVTRSSIVEDVVEDENEGAEMVGQEIIIRSVVIRSHYVTMVDNNRGRFFLAVEPAYAVVEYVFFISSRWYHMLLLSCSLHNCQPHRLNCGGCARVCATSSS